MARRQAVHRGRRRLHLGPADGEVPGEAALQSPQIVLQEPRSSHRQWRLRSHVPPEAAAAGLFDAARQRVLGDLSVRCAAGPDAPASDRHRPVQIRRVQAQRRHQGDKESGLLETGPALPRRHRIHDHPQPGDGGARVCFGASRHDISVQPDDAAAEGCAEPGAAGDLRGDAVRRRQPPRAGQPHGAALRQPRCCAGRWR